MSFKGKPVKVKLVGDAIIEYDELNKTVDEEISEGIKKSDHQILLKSIKQKIDLLKIDPQHGIHVGKEKIPKEYIKNYDANNIWKIDLPGYWRMIYTIKGSDVEIVAVVLDIIDHPTYNKKFGYKKR
jgi:hypothetical protein